MNEDNWVKYNLQYDYFELFQIYFVTNIGQHEE